MKKRVASTPMSSISSSSVVKIPRRFDIAERSPALIRWTNCMIRISIAPGSPPSAWNAPLIRAT